MVAESRAVVSLAAHDKIVARGSSRPQNSGPLFAGIGRSVCVRPSQPSILSGNTRSWVVYSPFGSLAPLSGQQNLAVMIPVSGSKERIFQGSSSVGMIEKRLAVAIEIKTIALYLVAPATNPKHIVPDKRLLFVGNHRPKMVDLRATRILAEHTPVPLAGHCGKCIGDLAHSLRLSGLLPGSAAVVARRSPQPACVQGSVGQGFVRAIRLILRMIPCRFVVLSRLPTIAIAKAACLSGARQFAAVFLGLQFLHIPFWPSPLAENEYTAFQTRG